MNKLTPGEIILIDALESNFNDNKNLILLGTIESIENDDDIKHFPLLHRNEIYLKFRKIIRENVSYSILSTILNFSINNKELIINNIDYAEVDVNNLWSSLYTSENINRCINNMIYTTIGEILDMKTDFKTFKSNLKISINLNVIENL